MAFHSNVFGSGVVAMVTRTDTGMTEPFTIAIDGPAAAGKGTISKAVAAHFGYAHLDTGLLYRAIGAKVMTGSDAIEATVGLRAEDLEVDGLRTAEVAQAASKVAVIPEVRAALLDFQRKNFYTHLLVSLVETI